MATQRKTETTGAPEAAAEPSEKVPGGERVLPIWIGPSEASAIAMEISGVKFNRPLTHDLFKQALLDLNVICGDSLDVARAAAEAERGRPRAVRRAAVRGTAIPCPRGRTPPAA